MKKCNEGNFNWLLFVSEAAAYRISILPFDRGADLNP
jgi:hypothetical protein